MSEELYQKVFSLLVEHRSMAFLEISALSTLDGTQLRSILDDLDKKGLVRISDRGDIFKEVITVREKAFTATPSYGD